LFLKEIIVFDEQLKENLFKNSWFEIKSIDKKFYRERNNIYQITWNIFKFHKTMLKCLIHSYVINKIVL
jgi:hypothetical protein